MKMSSRARSEVAPVDPQKLENFAGPSCQPRKYRDSLFGGLPTTTGTAVAAYEGIAISTATVVSTGTVSDSSHLTIEIPPTMSSLLSC